MNVCSEPGCARIQGERRCADHRRPGARQRGYGKAHDHLRAAYQRRMDAGEEFTCWRCLRPIDPNHWHLGHDDLDRSAYRGPECVPCNTATSGRISPGA